jgi:hypothetical protein
VNGSQMGDLMEGSLESRGLKYCEMKGKAKDAVARIILQADMGKSVSAAEGLRPRFVKKGVFEFYANNLQVEWDEAFIPGAYLQSSFYPSIKTPRERIIDKKVNKV